VSSSIFSPLNTPVNDWTGKRILLIGASSGIGAALAKAYLDRGATVMLSARRAEQLHVIAANHPNARILPFDVQDPTAWDEAQNDIMNNLGGLDLILFCAAKYQPERSWEIERSYVAQTLQINLNSVAWNVKTKQRQHRYYCERGGLYWSAKRHRLWP
jgi:NADP-dependent 3-hydroxy acid dehydrogenase YdfG